MYERRSLHVYSRRICICLFFCSFVFSRILFLSPLDRYGNAVVVVSCCLDDGEQCAQSGGKHNANLMRRLQSYIIFFSFLRFDSHLHGEQWAHTANGWHACTMWCDQQKKNQKPAQTFRRNHQWNDTKEKKYINTACSIFILYYYWRVSKTFGVNICTKSIFLEKDYVHRGKQTLKLPKIRNGQNSGLFTAFNVKRAKKKKKRINQFFALANEIQYLCQTTER